MKLTSVQLAVLKPDILADPVFGSMPVNGSTSFAIADAYNLAASPSYFVWRSTVGSLELMQGATFDWTRVDNLTVGKARIWDWMLRSGLLNPSLASVRAGINATFSVAADQATRLSAFTQCQRLASRIEKLFAVGAGSTTSDLGVGPSAMAFEGPISIDDVQQARELP